MSAYFYANDGLVASTQPERLQREFDLLTGLFDQVGLSMNKRKAVSIACQPCHTPGMVSLETYERRTMGMGPTFRERQWRRVNFPECGLEVASGSLLTHCQIQHVMGRGDWVGYPPSPREAQTYQVSFPKRMLRIWCPVEGFLWGSSNRTNLQVHFLHCHARDTIVILEEGN